MLAGVGQVAKRQGRWLGNETGPINDTTIGQKESQLGILDKFCDWVLHKLHMKLGRSGVKDRRQVGNWGKARKRNKKLDEIFIVALVNATFGCFCPNGERKLPPAWRETGRRNDGKTRG